MNTRYRKFLFYRVLGIISAVTLATYVVYNPSRPPVVILRNFNPQAGFHYNIYCLNYALYARERSNRKLVVLLGSGLYKEDRPNFTTDNPYYNKYDWFSYYFEPINQTIRPLSYWKKWVDTHPSMAVTKPVNLESVLESTLESTVARTRSYSPEIFNTTSFDVFLNSNLERRTKEFHRIWHQYFKLRPHIQAMVDDFKRKNNFANKQEGAPHACSSSIYTDWVICHR